jgi:hypothetical protein
MNAIMAAVLMLWMFGCASPGFIVQPVEDDPSLLVGLARASDGSSDAETRHDHPVNWSLADLQAILKRLVIQAPGGLMDSSGTPRPVFSPEDLTTLVPALHATFNIARPSDWIVFALWGGSEKTQGLEVTSGGMYLQDQRLHIILANHRERVSSEEDGIQAIHHNPFRALRDVKGRLMFYPTSYVIASRNNWIIGGFESPVSELILDYQALLATTPQEQPTGKEETTSLEISTIAPNRSRSTDPEVGVLQDEISNLKEELSRLQDQINQQAEERAKTKVPSSTLPSFATDPAPNPPSP